MIKKTLQLAVFILTILLSINARGQQYPDYVITVKGDSIRCLISAGATEYTDSATAAIEKIRPDRIREFYDNERRRLYRAVNINDKKSTMYYLAYAEKGTINLYYYYTDGSRYPGWPIYVRPYSSGGTYDGRGAFGPGVTGRSQIIWYVGKGSNDHVQDLNGPISFPIKTMKEKKEEFTLLLKDNPEVYNKFLTPGYYNLDHIQEIVHLYNTGERYDGTSDGAPLVAEKSYIITQKNDTVFCRIKNDYFTGKYMFKLAKQADFNVIDSTNADEFFYARDTSHFALINEPGVPGKVFLKQLEKGRVNFYQKTLLSNDLVLKELQSNLYISKGNGPLTLIGSRPNSARKFEIKYAQLKVFLDAIADNEALLSSFKKAIGNSATGKEDVIRFFVQNYNFLYSTNSASGSSSK